MITVIHLSCLFVGLVYLRTYRRLSHTVLSCIVSGECEHYVRISEKKMSDVGDFSGTDFRQLRIKDPSD